MLSRLQRISVTPAGVRLLASAAAHLSRLALIRLLCSFAVRGDVGDPQIRTDHPWYPGELACSTFERLFATEAGQYERVTGLKPHTDQDKALAAWFWRNTHYAHGEEGTEDLWGTGFATGDLRTREYWTGLFAHGFGLCGTTHAQWTAEMEQLLGHGRGRDVGVQGHNSFEVWLTGSAYGEGKWALLDHDISTVIFNPTGERLLSIPEISPDWKRLTDRKISPQKQQGWLVCGLYPEDGGVYADYASAEYLAGYAGPPPMAHLRRGETLALPSTGFGGWEDICLLGAQLPDRWDPRAGTLADLGQSAGEDVWLARWHGLQPWPGAICQRGLHLQTELQER